MCAYWKNVFTCCHGHEDFVGNETHIANAYEKSEFVWLCFSKSKLEFDQIVTKIGLNGLAGPDVDSQVTLHKRIVKQLIRLPFGEFHKQRRKTRYEYLTVFIEHTDDGSKEVFCENLMIPANRSYIITEKGFVKEQAMGRDVWIDIDGRDHKKDRYKIRYDIELNDD